ncbi:2-oxoglutarate dehydrogenase [Vibrio cyclitrophicus]
MKKTLLVTLVGVVVLAGCSQKGEAMNQSQENTNPICSTQNLTGGWSKSDITPQAVAGLNYAIEFEMDNGEVWNTIVYRSLQGDIEMMEVAQQGRLCQ